MRLILSIIGAAALIFNAPATAAPCAGTIYLTFDTGTMSQAEHIARILRQEQVRATFFLANERTFRGDHALDDTWAGFWRSLAADGHVFGNHTFRHTYFKRDRANGQIEATVDYGGPKIHLDETAFCAELRRVDARFQSLTGKHLSGLWRAPGGHTTQQAIRWAANCGYPVHVHWDSAGFIGDELDSERYPNAKLLARALERIRPGTVTMMHLGIRSRKDPLAPILEPLIRKLKARNYCFATLDGARR